MSVNLTISLTLEETLVHCNRGIINKDTREHNLEIVERVMVYLLLALDNDA